MLVENVLTERECSVCDEEVKRTSPEGVRRAQLTVWNNLLKERVLRLMKRLEELDVLMKGLEQLGPERPKLGSRV